MAIIKPSAIGRAAIIDAELGWPRGLALGRMSMIWSAAQADGGKSVAKKRLIIEWGCVEPELADRFVELCCRVSDDDEGDHVHFLELRDADRYFIVGNPEQLEKIATFKARASKAGKSGGKGRPKKKSPQATSDGGGSDPVVEETGDDDEQLQANDELSSESASSCLEEQLQEQLQVSPFPFPSPIPVPCPKPISPPSPLVTASKREASDLAEAAANEIFRLAHTVAPDEAMSHLAPVTRYLFSTRFTSWRRFESEYDLAAQKGDHVRFGQSVRKGFRAEAKLVCSHPATAPPLSS